jgi:hypothetical protein
MAFPGLEEAIKKTGFSDEGMCRIVRGADPETVTESSYSRYCSSCAEFGLQRVNDLLKYGEDSTTTGNPPHQTE